MKLIKLKYLPFCLLTMFSSATFAQDARIDNETYNANKVFNVYTKVGNITLIQFDEDEQLVGDQTMLGLGDKNAWAMGKPRANNISFKPAKKLPNTNLTIVTNKHTYLFELINIKKGDPTYLLRFDYPETVAAKKATLLAAENEQMQIIANAKAQKTIYNTNYTWRGENVLLKPTSAYDDGRFIHLSYNNAGSLPVFYKVMPDGSEALLNTNIDQEHKDTIILQDMSKVVRARLGKDVIEITNKSYQIPKFNNFGTTEKGAVRTLKNSTNDSNSATLLKGAN